MVQINNVDFEYYNAKLLKYEIDSCYMTKTYFLPSKSMNTKKINSDVGLRKIILKIDFEGEDEGKAAMLISDMTVLIRQGAELLLPDGYYYTVELDNVGKAVQTAPWILQTTYTLSGYRHGPLEEITLTATSEIDVIGNYDTEAVIEITTLESSITVLGITINNINGTVIIDGMKKTVTQDGINKFGDCNLIEFPKLVPGTNIIDITGTATVKISYYPIYL